MIITLENISPCLREIRDIQSKIAEKYVELQRGGETTPSVYDSLLQYQKEEEILIESLYRKMEAIIPLILTPKKRVRIHFFRDKVALSISTYDFILFYGDGSFSCTSQPLYSIYNEDTLDSKLKEINKLFFIENKLKI